MNEQFYELYHGDCLEILPTLEVESVDAVIADLPYGITQNKWDSELSLDRLWLEYKRITKPTSPIVLFCSQPFTSTLISSNLGMFKYTWVWDKGQVSNFLNSHKQPLRRTEDIAVFYQKQCHYEPQFTWGEPYTIHRTHESDNFGAQKPHETESDGRRFPVDIISITSKRIKGGHPTQKPVSLLKYLIQTYTHKGDIILDNTMGSGSTGVACIQTGRSFIGIEIDEDYFNIAQERIEQAWIETEESAIS